MLKIWGRSNSSNVQKVLWVCADLGIDFDRLDVGGKFGGNDQPGYRAMNPNGLVPTIQDGDLIVWESNTICRYLCNTRRGGAALYPTEPGLRSQVERWMDWQLSKLNTPLAALMWGYYRTPEDKRDKATLEKFREDAIGLWRILETLLESQPYLAGDAFTLADIVTGIWLHRWYLYPIERPDMPKLKAWYARLETRPGFVAHIAGPIS
ncbi:MAG TPA: glutathione S-transferase family protein [Stellaceae bacterium]|nr:glutathione S-transferase family protein [Stellaceae bacterium]